MKIGPRPKGEPHKGGRAVTVPDAPPNALQCAECGGPMRLLQLVSNETDERVALFYGCKKYPDCLCTHSAHADGTPMGKPANAATRAKRREAHAVFDLLWKRDNFMTRSAAYHWLAAQFGAEEIHMGSMDLEECEKAIRVSRAYLHKLQVERRKIERRRKRAGAFAPKAGPLLADKKHRAARHERKQQRQYRSEPPAAPKPEPEEEPPRSWWGRGCALEVLATQETGAIVLAEGVKLDDTDDLLEFEDEEGSARRELWSRLSEEGKETWRLKKATFGRAMRWGGRS